jgi:hypothetical protein
MPLMGAMTEIPILFFDEDGSKPDLIVHSSVIPFALELCLENAVMTGGDKTTANQIV